MRKLIKKTISFAVFVLLMNLILNLLLPEEVQDDRFAVRYDYFQSHKNDYNTVFFGTSRTLRHLNPETFDSINRTAGLETRSFNFGTPANKSYETYAQYEFFLENYQPGSNPVRYAFLEVNTMSPLTRNNLFARKSSYWVSLKNGNALYDHIEGEGMSAKSKLTYAYFPLATAIKYFGFNYLPPLVRDDADADVWIGPNHDGYIGQEEETERTHDPSQREKLVALRKSFEADTLELTTLKEKVAREFAGYKPKTLNKAHLAKLEELAALSKKKGIELRFVVHPRSESYRSLIPLKKALGDQMIMLVDPAQYPDLWEARTSFDAHHLSEKGAQLYVQYFCESFLSDTKIGQVEKKK